MEKIDGVGYPDDAIDLLKDTRLGPFFRAYLKKRGCPEKYIFLDAAEKKIDPKSQFKLFFADNAKHQVNAGSDSLLAAKRLGKAQDWKSKEWKVIYEGAVADTNRFVSGEFIEPFYKKDDDFRAVHVKNVEKLMLRTKYPALMKELDVVDKKGIATAAAMLKAGKKSDGPRSAKAFVKKNKIKMAPKEVIKKIKKAFKIK